MVEQSERALLRSERGHLARRGRAAEHAARTVIQRFGLISLVVCGALCAVTLAVSDSPWLVIVGVWTGLAGLFTIWTGLPERRDARRRMGEIAAALATDRARVTRIHGNRVVAFREIEDEGACWAFDAGDQRTIFVAGQMYGTEDGFPSSDVTFVEILLPNGAVVDELVSHDGPRLEPERWIEAGRRLEDGPPEHLAIVAVPLDRVGR